MISSCCKLVLKVNKGVWLYLNPNLPWMHVLEMLSWVLCELVELWSVWMCFDMFELVVIERKIFSMFLKWFAKKISGEKPFFLLLEDRVSYHVSQSIDTCEMHGSLGVFFSHWKTICLSFWDATLDAWVSRKVFQVKIIVLATEISCVLALDAP